MYVFLGCCVILKGICKDKPTLGFFRMHLYMSGCLSVHMCVFKFENACSCVVGRSGYILPAGLGD